MKKNHKKSQGPKDAGVMGTGRSRQAAACGVLALRLAASPAGAEPAEAARLLADVEPRIAAIYGQREFSARPFEATWLPDGAGYLKLETTPGESVADIVRYDAEDGSRTVAVAGGTLDFPAGAGSRAIRSFIHDHTGGVYLLRTSARDGGGEESNVSDWLYDVASGNLRAVDAGPGARFEDGTFSPDGSLLLGRRGGNLLVHDPASGRTMPLTEDGTDDGVFNRDAAWSPDGRWIAFVQSDMTEIPKRAILVPGDPTYRTFREVRYARIGGPIPKLRVGIVAAEGGPTRWVALPDEPGTFYLNQASWAGNSDEVLIEKLSRFRDSREFILANHRTGAITRVHGEVDHAWVDMIPSSNHGIEWIGDGTKAVIISERDGWRRAYIVSRDGARSEPITPGGIDVIARGLADADGEWYYHDASPDNATQRYLFRVRLDGSGEAERLTPADQPGTHRYVFSPCRRWAFHTWSTFDRPPVTTLVELPSHRAVRILEDNAELAAKVAPLVDTPAEFFHLDIGDGVVMDAWMIKPRAFDPERKYPVLLFVYGEPAGQTVLDDWRGGQGNTLFHRALADLGYLVVSMDNRGTPAPKGGAWRRAVFGSLGPLSTEEQAAGLQELVRQRAYVDPSRVAIWGWSGGGSNTLNALFRKPDLYHVGIAVVPKPMPEYYNAGYQELYMRTPEVNPEGYRECAPITYADGLRGRLLIIVGTGETNTHVEITEGLVDRLIELGKPFDYFAYPNRDHGLREGKGTEVHLRMLIARYLLENLPAGPR